MASVSTGNCQFGVGRHLSPVGAGRARHVEGARRTRHLQFSDKRRSIQRRILLKMQDERNESKVVSEHGVFFKQFFLKQKMISSVLIVLSIVAVALADSRGFNDNSKRNRKKKKIIEILKNVYYFSIFISCSNYFIHSCKLFVFF